jgi:hypothetical protein
MTTFSFLMKVLIYKKVKWLYQVYRAHNWQNAVDKLMQVFLQSLHS